MAKAMLIMDMPTTCVDCNLCRATREKHTGQLCWECVARHMIMITKKEAGTTKPTWCPLREVPEKKEMKTFTEFLEEKQDVKVVENFVAEEFMKYGYNACIDEILGGDE